MLSKLTKGWARLSKLSAATLALLSVCLLPACHLLFPEKMDATIDINSDWTYTIEFTGVLTDYLARSTRLESGALTSEEQKSMEELEDSLRADRRFRRVRYLGGESYEVEFFETGILQGQTDVIGGEYFARVLSITPKPDDHVMIEGVEFKDEAELEEAMQSLEKSGMGMDWHIRVNTDAEVVAHNAGRTPWFFGLFGAYEWEIDSLDDPMPLMVLKLE